MTLYFREGKSDKFYTAVLNGMIVTFIWGRRGTDGQTAEKVFASPFQAREAYLDKLAEKRAKGYRQTLPAVKDEDAIEADAAKALALKQSPFKNQFPPLKSPPAKSPPPPKPPKQQPAGRRLFSLDD